MTFTLALLLGVLEGLTEYLPISSTFHLIWASRFFGVEQSEFQKLFEVVIQSGAILAVVVLYANLSLRNRGLVKKVLVSFVPTAVVGFLFYDIIKDVFFERADLQLFVFALVGLLFIFFERRVPASRLTRTIDRITLREALLIGVCQSLAIVPGVSRAGAVIVALMALRVKRTDAAMYSFLLALPTLLSASALDLYQSRALFDGNAQYATLLVVGFIAAFVSALATMKWFISYLQNHTLSAFGWYRLALAGLLVMSYQ